jgi:hypothetical protein
MKLKAVLISFLVWTVNLVVGFATVPPHAGDREEIFSDSKQKITFRWFERVDKIVPKKGLQISALGSLLLITALLAPQESQALESYSANARNMERLSNGDASGGSIYNNFPTTDAAKRRRAMMGCKSQSVRDETAPQLSMKSLSERDCNMIVMESGESAEFLLEAIRKLECPTCPYGISPTR